MRIAFFCHTREKNALGRAYSLWLVARELGWEARIVSPPSSTLWPPIVDEKAFVSDLVSDAAKAASWCDVVLSLKPWPGSFDRALEMAARFDKPIVLDVDDPDFEALFGSTRRRQLRVFLASLAKGRPPKEFYYLRWRASRSRRTLVSNPALLRWYRGAVIPHARLSRPEGKPHIRTRDLRIAFVGTIRSFKGIDILREAVRKTSDMRLAVTAPPPRDATPNETWTGEISLSEGLDLIDAADVVVLPSLKSPYSEGQLPVKLIDAMISGRAIIASGLPPIDWALADAGLLVPPGDAQRLSGALEACRSPELRTEFGTRARGRALEMFTPAAIAPGFADALGRLA
jgi:glycosyltransferase involved in cell wall biosynthesis